MRREPGAAPPPSERRAARGGRSNVLRLAGWGVGLTLGLAIFVTLVLLVAYLRNDPGRNPVPAGYREAACAAFTELGAGVTALERGDEDEVRERLDAANAAVTDLPSWAPGEPFNELLASLIITLTNGADALAAGENAAEEIESARTLDDAGRRQLAEGAYGFDCDR